jgi:chromosome segregation ATPase
MATYVVHNFHDQQQLRSILNRVWQDTGDRSFQPVVMKLTRTPRYAVKPPAVKCPLVLDCLQIDDAWAFNAVIFLCKPDRFALHDGLDDAVNFLRAHRGGGQGPSPLSGAFLSDGGKVTLRGAGTVTSERRNEPDLFRVSQAEKLRELEGVVASTTADFESLQSLARKKKDEVTSVTKEMHRLKMEGRTLTGRIEEVDRLLGRVEDERERQRMQQEKQDDSQYMQDNVDAENEQHEFEGEVEKLQQQDHSKYAERIAVLEKERNALQAQFAECEAAIDAEQKALGAFVFQWSGDERKLTKYNTLVEELREKLRELDADLIAQSARLAETEQRAVKFAPERPPPAELAPTCKQLDAMVLFKEDTLKEKRRSAPINLSEVQNELKRTQLEKAETEAGMAKVIANTHSIKEANHERVLKMVAYRKTLADAASYVFNSLLEMSGGSGRLDFDTDRRTLQLIVNPNTADAEREDAADTVALSGGERSTTTIAFVMAVGEQVDCPIRAFDEFDVFMVRRSKRTRCSSRTDRAAFVRPRGAHVAYACVGAICFVCRIP